jgi:uncharacterized membrane protein
MKPNQPRLTLERTGADALLEGLAVAGWLAGIATLLVTWPDLPDRLPMHFDVSGRPNRWGPRAKLFVLPTISLVLLVGLTVLSRFPHIYNYVVVITEQNAERQYRLAVHLIRFLSVLLQWMFAVILWDVVGASQGLPHSGIWLVPAFVAGTFVLLIVYLVKASSEPSSGRSS